MTRQSNVVLAAVCLVILTGGFASAAIYDHFDDGVLGPEWDVSFYNSTGWSYSETGTQLTVTDIPIVDPAFDLYSKISISQNFNATGDFEAEFSFSWDSGALDSGTENMQLQLWSGENAVVRAGYYDPWLYHRGAKMGAIGIGSSTYDSGENSLANAGSAVVEITRVSGLVTILWNGTALLSGTNSDVIDQLKIDFTSENCPGATFNSLSVDYVSAVPEPATLLLLGLGAVLFRRRGQ